MLWITFIWLTILAPHSWAFSSFDFVNETASTLESTFMPEIVSQLITYSQASGLYVLSEDFNDYAIIESCLRSGTWYKKLNISENGIRKRLTEDVNKPLLILLPLDASMSIKFVKESLDDVELLESVTWLLFSSETFFPLETAISPLLRLFVVNTECLEKNNCVSLRTNINFWHWDYRYRRPHLSPVGQWSVKTGLRMDIPHRQCCYNLTGMPIKAIRLTFPEPFIIMKNINGKVKMSGIFGDIFIAICESLGLRYEVHDQKDNVYGDYPGPSGNGTGMIRELALKNFDMTCNGMSITEGRSHVVDYSYPVVQSSIKAIYKYTKHDQFYSFYLKPFSNLSWTLIASASTTYILLAYFIASILCLRTVNSVSFMEFYTPLVSQGVEYQSKVSSGMKLLHYSFMLLGFLLSMFFSSKLISQNTVLINELPFDTFDELAQNKQYKPIADAGDTSRITFMENSNEPEFVEILKKLRENSKNYLVFNNEQILRELDTEKAAYIGHGLNLNYLRLLDKSIRITNAEFMKAGLYFAFQKKSHIRRIFNEKIMAMREQGVIDRIVKSYVNTDHKVNSSSVSVPEIQLFQVSLSFLILGVGLFVSISTLAIEIYILNDA